MRADIQIDERDAVNLVGDGAHNGIGRPGKARPHFPVLCRGEALVGGVTGSDLGCPGWAGARGLGPRERNLVHSGFKGGAVTMQEEELEIGSENCGWMQAEVLFGGLRLRQRPIRIALPLVSERRLARVGSRFALEGAPGARRQFWCREQYDHGSFLLASSREHTLLWRTRHRRDAIRRSVRSTSS